MRHVLVTGTVSLVLLCVLHLGPAFGADDEETGNLEEKIRALEERIEELEQEKAGAEAEEALKAEIAAMLGEELGGAEEASIAQQMTSCIGRAFQSFNPDISVIGDFLFHYQRGEAGEEAVEEEADHEHAHTEDGDHHHDTENQDKFYVREVELALSGSVDPYCRGDIFLGLHQHGSDWDFHLEEGYLTFLTLPWGLQAKAGQFKTHFGKINLQHPHNFPWVDLPNVVQQYFGHEGMSEPGLSMSWLVPNPFGLYMELTGEMQNNANSASFAGDEFDDFIFTGHLTSFYDISEDSTVELGLSGATGPNDENHGDMRTWIGGVDLTFKWRPLQAGLYRSLLFQNEFFFGTRDALFEVHHHEHDGEEHEGEEHEDEEHEHHHYVDYIDSWGMYSALRYQFSRRWSSGLRFDYAEVPTAYGSHEYGYSAVLTFAQSEYLFWRVQYKHTDRNYDRDTDEVWLQLNFGLGPHRAHQY